MLQKEIPPIVVTALAGLFCAAFVYFHQLFFGFILLLWFLARIFSAVTKGLEKATKATIILAMLFVVLGLMTWNLSSDANYGHGANGGLWMGLENPTVVWGLVPLMVLLDVGFALKGFLAAKGTYGHNKRMALTLCAISTLLLLVLLYCLFAPPPNLNVYP